jgi:hypothetical protein
MNLMDKKFIFFKFICFIIPLNVYLNNKTNKSLNMGQYINKRTGDIINESVYNMLYDEGKINFSKIEDGALRKHFEKLINESIDNHIKDLETIKNSTYQNIYSEKEFIEKLKDNIDNIFKLHNDSNRIKVHLNILE